MVNIKSFSCAALFSITICHAGTNTSNDNFNHPFYVGAMIGYGSTTWNGLVPTKENQNLAMNMSTPKEVEEGGRAWGVVVGYEFVPAFALEGSYMNYPKASVFFDPDSLFSFNNHDLTKFVTQTELLSVMGKIMLLLPNPKFKIYSSLGAAVLHREDMLINDWRVSPTFGGGLNYYLTEHLVSEIAGTYTAGYGESQLDPSTTYFPFLYSVTFRLAYHF